MILYRIYTENKNLDQIEAKATKLLKSYTITKAIGYWEGSREDSIVIEHLTDWPARIVIEELAAYIKKLNQQEVVLVTHQEVETWLV